MSLTLEDWAMFNLWAERYYNKGEFMKITVYSTQTCPFCVQLKQWLDKKGYAYTDYMVDKNPYAAQIMIRQSGQMGVPFTTIEREDGTMEKILGFDRQKLSTILES